MVVRGRRGGEETEIVFPLLFSPSTPYLFLFIYFFFISYNIVCLSGPRGASLVFSLKPGALLHIYASPFLPPNHHADAAAASTVLPDPAGKINSHCLLPIVYITRVCLNVYYVYVSPWSHTSPTRVLCSTRPPTTNKWPRTCIYIPYIYMCVSACRYVRVCVCVFHYIAPSEPLLYTHTTHTCAPSSIHGVGY